MLAATHLSDAKRLLLERRLRGEISRPRPDADIVRPRQPGVPVPISPEQGQVWLHASLAPGLPLYNESVTIHRRGPFDLSVMQQCFDELLRRHEAWRTSFEPMDSEVVQIVHPALRVVLPLIDLSHLSREAAEQEALRLAAADARSPINMTDAPLFRAKVVQLSAEEHRLQLTIHHIIFDGVSLYRVLMPELAALYEAFAAGRPSPLPEPTLQYADYAIWRRRDAAQDEYALQMRHWRRELAGELPMLQLPFDRPRPPAVTHRGATELFSLPLDLIAALHTLSRTEGVTLYMTLLAAYKALLFRYTGQEDIVIGGVTDARRRPELEQLIGYFLNPISLRTRPAAALPFRDFLLQTRNAALGALGASDVPFDQVVRELHIRRDPAFHPIFTVFFSIQPPVDLVDPAWDLTQMDVGSGAAKFDIYVELEERPDGMMARFIYNADLFDACTMQRMAAHYQTLLQGVALDPGRTLAGLPVMTAGELRLLQEWNRTARHSPQTTLHGLVEEQARRSPQAPAVIFGEARWSYAELDRQADRIAGWLRHAGAGPGQLVGLCVERSLDMVAAVMAVLKAGAAYLPLDPALPQARLDFIVGDAAPVLLLTQRNLRREWPAGLPVLLLEDIVQAAAGPAGFASVSGAGPDGLAYVLYTSGTTGRPKGVEVLHRAVVNVIAALGDAVGCWAGDTLLAVTTLSFDIATLELFMPLAFGGQLVIVSRDVAVDPALLAELIQSSGCTVMQATPATWRRLVESGWTDRPRLKMLCGGESLSRSLADALLSRGGRLWNVYGPTEATIWATMHEVTRDVGAVPIGRPIANLLTAIVDAHGNAVPIGVAGELHIGGIGVARGYRGREYLTRDRFCVRDGARWYHTGDMARYRPDGVIEYLGRSDGQVKVRGFRVELDEIEGAIAAHPRVASAAIRAGPDSSGETSLAAYVVAREGAGSGPPPDAAELRRFLQASLPDYMVPAQFLALDAIPLSSAGKIDRNALPMSAPRDAAIAPAEPQDEWERRLAEVWAGVLGVGAVGRNDDFFDLGGHSILVAKLQGRIAAEFGRNLSLAALFQAATVASMALILREQDGRASQRPSRLLQVKPMGSLPRLYWVDPSPSFRRVADALGREQPVLGLSLDAAALDKLGEAPSLEAMASCLVHSLFEADPVGPYRLGGFCNKGLLAFEMASQLLEAGHSVATLVLVESFNPATWRRNGSLAVELSKLRFHVAATRHLSGRHRVRYATDRMRTLFGRLVPLRTVAERKAPIDLLLPRASLRWVPKPYPGDVHLLQVVERPDLIDAAPSWAGVVTGRLIGRAMQGAHDSLFEPRNAASFAAAIRDSLDDAGG